jgi:hypothetical protein
MTLPPWAEGSFELIFHAELHFRAGEDFDRRIAMIGFDNAIEVAITTYLSLHPMHRSGRTYIVAQVQQWLTNYHTKIEFFELECGQRGVAVSVARTHIVWYHQIRNKQYHEGGSSTPNLADLRGVRQAALSVFSVLYDVPEVERILAERMAASAPPAPPQPDQALDRVLDESYGLVEVAGKLQYTSELLFNLDPALYRELGLELLNAPLNDGDSVE